MNGTVLITGVTGQTGSYLADILLKQNYDVHGLIRRCSTVNDSRIKHLDKLKHHYGDLSDASNMLGIIEEIKPDYIFNMAAQSHVKISYEIPEYTADITGIGPLRILEAIRKLGLKNTRFLQASTSEMFGNEQSPQSEETPLNPESPYAAAKIFAYHVIRNYRKSYNMFACNSICFNHTSERRGDNFVTRKITKAAVRIKLGLQDKLQLGNIDSYRDWGHAYDYANAMIKIIQHDIPDDFVVASGETHCVREFLEIAFDLVGLDTYKYVEIDPNLFRPSEVNYLLGNPSKIKKTLGWEPEISFKEIVKRMIDYDMEKELSENRSR